MTTINEYTTVEIDNKYINQDILKIKLEQLEASYIESISWLFWYKSVIENNDASIEAEAANIVQLETEKTKIEKNLVHLTDKIDFLKGLLI